MFYVYVLRSKSDHGLYIGYSADLRRRIAEHRQGLAFATSFRGPWELIYYEAYVDEEDALGRERHLKSGGFREGIGRFGVSACQGPGALAGVSDARRIAPII